MSKVIDYIVENDLLPLPIESWAFDKEWLLDEMKSWNGKPFAYYDSNKNKILKNSKKQKDMRIDINDRFKDFLKQLCFNSNLNNILAPVYMNIRMMCKEPLIMYSHFFQKDFFSNKPKARIVSEAEDFANELEKEE